MKSPAKVKELVLKNRSYRRFNQSFEISKHTLLELIDLARLSASGRNQQSLKYLISNTPEHNAKVFPHLSWAGFLTDWNGPVEGERPSAYLIFLHDSSISETHFCDEGIAAQSILLGATEIGLGGCIFWSVKRDALRSDWNIPEQYKILQVVALGQPVETAVIEDIKDNDYKYWRDENQVHHVPKRSLNEIVLNL